MSDAGGERCRTCRFRYSTLAMDASGRWHGTQNQDLRDKYPLGMTEDEYVTEYDELASICRRFPPVVGDDNRSMFPEVALGDWCGEYQSTRVGG